MLRASFPVLCRILDLLAQVAAVCGRGVDAQPNLPSPGSYINEDDQAAPKVGRGTVDATNVVALQRKSG
jgi:hypothetical protein